MTFYTEAAPYASTRRCVAVTPTREDVRRLVADVRPHDRDEWVAFTGCPMLPYLEAAIEHPALIFKRIEDGYPLCVFGAHSLPPDYEQRFTGAGLLWFAATNKGYEHLPDLAVLTEAAIRFLHMQFPHLVAFTDARNFEHHQWLVTLGFDFTDYVELGPWSLPFWQVERWSDRSNNECVRPS